MDAATLFMLDLALVLVLAGVAGWVCQRAGLSSVVGYLGAGMVVGPYTPPFQLVADLDRIQLLAQVGLVFLVFSIGLSLNLQRFQRLGMSVVAGTLVGAVLVFNVGRGAALALGWSATEGMFLAGVMMVSSSAIIARVLEEQHATHARYGQLALGVTVLEDVVAVVMLTLLSSLAQPGGSGTGMSVLATAGTLISVAALLGAVTLLVVPRALAHVGQDGGGELQTVLVGGLAMLLAWVAVRLGYSSALGAFLLGAILGSTPLAAHVMRAFGGVRQIFGAVFFVAMGMLFDVSLLVDAWPQVLGVTALSLVARTLATATGLWLAGNPTEDALKAGLVLNPLGEFSFIMAQLGVSATVLPPEFYPMAVGVALLTSLVAPLLTRHAASISARALGVLPGAVTDLLGLYPAWLERLARTRASSPVWTLTTPRLIHVGATMLLVSAVLILAAPVHELLDPHAAVFERVPGGLPVVFGAGVGLFLLAPAVAVARNVNAIAMIVAEAMTSGQGRGRALEPWVRGSLRAVILVVLGAWVLALLPLRPGTTWTFVALLGGLGLLTVLLWRNLVRWHAALEVEMGTQWRMAAGGAASQAPAGRALAQGPSWNLQMVEVVLPENADVAGRRIRDLALRSRVGCSVVAIDRQGTTLLNPRADEVLYAQDRVMLLGTPEQLEAAEATLAAPARERRAGLEDMAAEPVTVPLGSPLLNTALVDLDLIRRTGVQVGAIRRAGVVSGVPSGKDVLMAGDVLLVLGSHAQIQQLKDLLQPVGVPGVTVATEPA